MPPARETGTKSVSACCVPGCPLNTFGPSGNMTMSPRRKVLSARSSGTGFVTSPGAFGLDRDFGRIGTDHLWAATSGAQAPAGRAIRKADTPAPDRSVTKKASESRIRPERSLEQRSVLTGTRRARALTRRRRAKVTSSSWRMPWLILRASRRRWLASTCRIRTSAV